VAGEKLFVDYAGTTIDFLTRHRARCHACQTVRRSLVRSSYTYAEATATQSLRAGNCLIPDRTHGAPPFAFSAACRRWGSTILKSASSPKLLLRGPPSIAPMRDGGALQHRRSSPARATGSRATRPGRIAGQDATRWIIASSEPPVLSLPELNAAIGMPRNTQRNRVSRHLGGEPAHLVRRDDRPALKPASNSALLYAEWKAVQAPASIITLSREALLLGCRMR